MKTVSLPRVQPEEARCKIKSWNVGQKLLGCRVLPKLWQWFSANSCEDFVMKDKQRTASGYSWSGRIFPRLDGIHQSFSSKSISVHSPICTSLERKKIRGSSYKPDLTSLCSVTSLARSSAKSVFVLVPFSRNGFKSHPDAPGFDFFADGRVGTPPYLFFHASAVFGAFFKESWSVCCKSAIFPSLGNGTSRASF